MGWLRVATAFGQAIRDRVQRWSARLDSIDDTLPRDGTFLVGQGMDWVGETGATARTSMGAQTQGDVLDDLNTLGANAADGEFLVGTGAGALAWESGATARTSMGVGTTDSPQFAGLGLGAAKDSDFTLYVNGDIGIVEQAAAPTMAAAQGGVWVLTDTPNCLMFTDDESHSWCVSGCGDNAVQRSKTASQDVAGTGAIVTFPTSVDAGLGWTYAAGVFTATRDGRVEVQCTYGGVTITSCTYSENYLRLNSGAINGTQMYQGYNAATNTYAGFTHLWEGAVSNGDTIDVYADPNANSLRIYYGWIRLRWVKP